MKHFFWISILSVAIGLVAQSSLAGPRDEMRSYSLESAVSRARNQYQGRVISAETEKQNGQRTHKIRILTDDGRLERLRVDPNTGDYIRPEHRPRRR